MREPTPGSELSTVLLEGGPHTLLRLSVELAGSRASAAPALTGGLERYLGSVARGLPVGRLVTYAGGEASMKVVS